MDSELQDQDNNKKRRHDELATNVQRTAYEHGLRGERRVLRKDAISPTMRILAPEPPPHLPRK